MGALQYLDYRVPSRVPLKGSARVTTRRVLYGGFKNMVLVIFYDFYTKP